MARKYLTASQVLTKALHLIDRKSRWIKGVMHQRQTQRGRRVDCFCAQGAITYAAPNGGGNTSGAMGVLREAINIRPLSHLIGFSDGVDITNFNDAKKTTHRNVVAAFKRAIKLARELERA